MCALGPYRTAGLAAHLAASLRRLSYQTSSRFAARGAPRGVQRGRARGRHDRRRSRKIGMPFARCCSRCRGCLHMKHLWLAMRSAILWILSGLHFFLVSPSLVFLGIFLDPRKHDWLQRGLCTRIAFLSGARVEIIPSTGFDATPTGVFFVNNANLFYPFMLYYSI